ncbi:hypothetical protein PAXRUDRAFT_347713, partial [Paxillus rubicundulus Ve08.2h10]
MLRRRLMGGSRSCCVAGFPRAGFIPYLMSRFEGLNRLVARGVAHGYRLHRGVELAGVCSEYGYGYRVSKAGPCYRHRSLYMLYPKSPIL